jgi:hypothetical protein
MCNTPKDTKEFLFDSPVKHNQLITPYLYQVYTKPNLTSACFVACLIALTEV